MAIRKSGEDYLEAMLVIKEQKGYVRQIDVARRLGITKASVSYATKKLHEEGYLNIDSDNMIILTDEGQEIAEKIYNRHKMLSKFLKYLGVDDDIADDDACKIEHDISEESFNAICAHVNDFLATRPAAEDEKCSGNDRQAGSEHISK